MTKEQAIKMANSGWWEHVTPEEAALFQLYEPLMCMSFGKFHDGVEKLLGRAVWFHEFADMKRLQAEAEGRGRRPCREADV